MTPSARKLAELSEARKHAEDKRILYEAAIKSRAGIDIAYRRHVAAVCEVMRLEVKL